MNMIYYYMLNYYIANYYPYQLLPCQLLPLTQNPCSIIIRTWVLLLPLNINSLTLRKAKNPGTEFALQIDEYNTGGTD